MVVLPAPDGPIIDVTCPAAAVPETFFRISTVRLGSVLEGTEHDRSFQAMSIVLYFDIAATAQNVLYSQAQH